MCSIHPHGLPSRAKEALAQAAYHAEALVDVWPTRRVEQLVGVGVHGVPRDVIEHHDDNPVLLDAAAKEHLVGLSRERRGRGKGEGLSGVRG